MNKLVKGILCISTQISIALISFICFGIAVYLLITNPTANKAFIALIVGTCWFLT